MVEEYTIALAKVIKELGLSEVYLPRSADEILIPPPMWWLTWYPC